MLPMSRIALHLIALSVVTTPAVTQPVTVADSTRPRFTIGSTETMLGYARFSLPELDHRFVTAGLPKMASATMTVGFGVDLRAGRFLIGAGVQSLLARSESGATYRTRSSGSQSQFDVGFAAIQTPRLSIYPVFGVGVANLAVNVKERGDFAFNDGIAHPFREIGLSGTTALAHTGILLERRLLLRGSAYSISVRFGINHGVGTRRWGSAESRVTDGPSGMRSSYTRIGFARPLGSRRAAVLPLAAILARSAVQ